MHDAALPPPTDWHAAAAAAGETGGDGPLPDGWRTAVAYRDGDPVARLAFGRLDELPAAPGKNLVVGWFAAVDPEAGTRLLRGVAGTPDAGRVRRILGPVNGSTWGRYRLVLPPDPGESTEPPFLGEPANPGWYVRCFENAGFAPVRFYGSAVVDAPADDASARAARETRLGEAGIRMRPLAPERFGEELERIYRLSREAFAENAFYTPISLESLRGMYAAMRPLLDPALVWFAERDGETLGYVFAYPDLPGPASGPRIVLKTLATAPGARRLGLGEALVRTVHGEAARRGASVIHALMEASNASRALSSKHGARPVRRYAVYGLERP